MESLDVYLNDRKVGRLDDENGSLTFAYDAGYLSSGARELLSHALALRPEPYAHGDVEPVLSRRVRREAPVVARRCQRKWPSSVYSAIEAGIADRLDQLSEEE